ncbi:ABC transporter permease [Aureimonas pseudogalii]|uniref:Ribose transport system permease protein n=1 Tax=Aureimonas pseudogalii TaxID=1744844 RepID=A0A7W6EG78_9HYPH|nr:ABC transporter permease [Aureimonas pseudogalii]MBB3997663.1 ribose transport system permease protein [Aureimonas pseudogalii]
MTAPAPIPATTSASRFVAPVWLWSFVGAALVWGLSVAVAGQGAGGMLTTALAFSVFTVMVGLGQMAVVTLGPGNIDLSIPANIGLASAVAMKVMDGADGMIAVGLLAALGAGVAIGAFNYLLIWLLRIPPIIATLSASFIIQSVGISYGRGLQIKPPPAFTEFTLARIAGVPILFPAAVILSLLAGLVLHRTIYGRTVSATGQNMRAARLAGLAVGRTRLLTYILSGALAALCGALLAGFSGGSSLSMGREYLLASIAVVVLGGTSVAGGRAVVTGLWGGALFLFMISTLLNTAGFGSGLRDVLTGLIIIAAIAATGSREGTR